MITTDPRAIATEIIAELQNLAAWLAEFSDDRLSDISETLQGVREDGPAAGLITAYRQGVLEEIDRRKRARRARRQAFLDEIDRREFHPITEASP